MSFYLEQQQQYLTVQPSYYPSSPSADSFSTLSSPASFSTSPNLSEIEDFTFPMSVENVKRLLRMVPPPMTAEEFIAKNPFKGSEGHIKRPSNNFILFRKIAHDQKNQTDELSDYNEREFSKIIGEIWGGLSAEEKDEYKKLGKRVADVHKKMFPDYKYQPKRDKAAWKHFNPNEPSSQKPRNKRKNNIKLQKQQNTTPEIINNVPLPIITKVNLSIQEPQIVSPISPNFLQTNNLSISTDLNSSMYYDYPDSFSPANNTPIFEGIGYDYSLNGLIFN